MCKIFRLPLFVAFLFILCHAKKQLKNKQTKVRPDAFLARSGLTKKKEGNAMQNKEIITVAMDIDDFLTTMDIKHLKEQDHLDPLHYKQEYFINITFDYQQQEHSVVNLLTPGCADFLRFLFDHENVRPAFFSAGLRVRNVVLASQIVQMLVDTGGDPGWMDRYEVYSREDCLDTTYIREGKEFQPKNFFGNYKKDLRMIYYGREKYREKKGDLKSLHPNKERDDEILKNIILIEEDSSYLFPGQEKNMLLSPSFFHPDPTAINYQEEEIPDDYDDTFRSFKSDNTIFYAAGVMNRTLERFVSEDLTVPEILWEEQGAIWYEPDDYKKRFPIHFFKEGRAALRKYNPDLNFIVRLGKDE
jgi:hypothetical protein